MKRLLTTIALLLSGAMASAQSSDVVDCAVYAYPSNGVMVEYAKEETLFVPRRVSYPSDEWVFYDMLIAQECGDYLMTTDSLYVIKGDVAIGAGSYSRKTPLYAAADSTSTVLAEFAVQIAPVYGVDRGWLYIKVTGTDLREHFGWLKPPNGIGLWTAMTLYTSEESASRAWTEEVRAQYAEYRQAHVAYSRNPRSVIGYYIYERNPIYPDDFIGVNIIPFSTILSNDTKEPIRIELLNSGIRKIANETFIPTRYGYMLASELYVTPKLVDGVFKLHSAPNTESDTTYSGSHQTPLEIHDISGDWVYVSTETATGESVSGWHLHRTQGE